MIKTHYRDYATEAWRLYARLGSAEAYKRRIYAEAQQRHAEGGSGGVGSPTEAAVLRGEAAVAEKEGVWRDLEAVERAVERIASLRNGDCILRAVLELPHDDAQLLHLHYCMGMRPGIDDKQTYYYGLRKAVTAFQQLTVPEIPELLREKEEP